MKKLLTSLRMFLWLSILTGVAYPLIITAIAQLTMYQKASGDFIIADEKIVGSALIAQKFVSNKYFWARPSSIDYNPITSGGSNLGPTSKVLKNLILERQASIAKVQGLSNNQSIPSELLFSSGSGLDPHISPATARFQIERILKARGMDEKTGEEALLNLIDSHTEKRRLGFLGRPIVNVLKLNLALDRLTH